MFGGKRLLCLRHYFTVCFLIFNWCGLFINKVLSGYVNKYRYFTANVLAKIVLRIEDVFSKPTIFLDWGSSLVMAVALRPEHKEQTPIWTFQSRVSREMTLARDKVLYLIVNETFRFGKYTVKCGTEVHSIQIPFRLGEVVWAVWFEEFIILVQECSIKIYRPQCVTMLYFVPTIIN